MTTCVPAPVSSSTVGSASPWIQSCRWWENICHLGRLLWINDYMSLNPARRALENKILILFLELYYPALRSTPCNHFLLYYSRVFGFIGKRPEIFSISQGQHRHFLPTNENDRSGTGTGQVGRYRFEMNTVGIQKEVRQGTIVNGHRRWNTVRMEPLVSVEEISGPAALEHLDRNGSRQ